MTLTAQEIVARAKSSQIELTNGELPADVQWMPPGRQVVQPFGFDEPFEMDVTPAIAAAADVQLQQLRSANAEGLDAAPYGDFNHENRARAFLARRFFWGGDHPKNGGVRLALDWTGAGAKAVKNGEQCAISASWLLHKFTKAFLGIKHNVGGLVPRSAFHSIQAFAKAEITQEPNLFFGYLPQDEVARLEEKYGVDLTPPYGWDKHEGFLLAQRLGEKNGTSEDYELPNVWKLEPDLWDHYRSLLTGMDVSKFRGKFWTGAKSKELADALSALAKDAQQRYKVPFDQAWAMAVGMVRGSDSREKQQADACYRTAREHSVKGVPFGEAYARATVAASLDRALAKPRNPAAASAFRTHAKAFASASKLSETDGLVAFLDTPAGNWLYQEFAEASAK